MTTPAPTPLPNYVPTFGRMVGQRCQVCKGAVKWIMGGRPSHVYAQDFADVAGATHAALLESAEPTHYWVPGENGAPDALMQSDTPMDVALAAVSEASAIWVARHADDKVDTTAWQVPDDPFDGRQDGVDTQGDSSSSTSDSGAGGGGE